MQDTSFKMLEKIRKKPNQYVHTSDNILKLKTFDTSISGWEAEYIMHYTVTGVCVCVCARVHACVCVCVAFLW